MEGWEELIRALDVYRKEQIELLLSDPSMTREQINFLNDTLKDILRALKDVKESPQ